MLARLLRDEPDDEEDDAILSLAQAYRPVSAQSANLELKGVDCDLVEVCKHAQLRLASLIMHDQACNFWGTES